MDRVLSKKHIKKRRELSSLLKKRNGKGKGKRGWGSAVDRLALDVLHSLLLCEKNAFADVVDYIWEKYRG